MFKKLTLLATMTILITSCGVPLPLQKDLVVKDIKAVRQFATTNPVFSEYIKEFEQQGKVITGEGSFSVGDIPINFGDTENEAFQGVCFQYPDGTREVIIRKNWWDAADKDYRESLLFHELGHCRLDREHTEEIFLTQEERSYKASLMSSVIVGPKDYKDYKEEYLKELFLQKTDDLLTSLGLNFD